MKSRGVRMLLLLLALAALAAAGAGVWQLEQRIAQTRSLADTFERDTRQAVVVLGDWRAAQQAYVAEGQPPEAWIAKATAIAQDVGPRLSALRSAAASAEAQSALEAAIEAFASATQNDAKARDYVRSGQRLSASDVIFVSVAPALERATVGVDTARGQEQVAFAVAIEDLRRWELIALGSAAGVLLIVLLLLVPIPRLAGSAPGFGDSDAAADEDSVLPLPRGLNLSRDFDDGVVSGAQPLRDLRDDLTREPDLVREPDRARVSSQVREPGRTLAEAGSKSDAFGPFDFSLDDREAAKGPDLDAVADLCLAMARVQDTRELHSLLERTAKALDATGVIVWMADGAQGTLRPVLAHGYTPLTLSRMGIIHPASDNATATAFRTRSTVVVPAEPLSSGAVVAPLISWEGCSGAMAVELREGVEASPPVRAVATIVAAQLATMFTPGTLSSTPAAVPAPAGAQSWPGPSAERA